MGSMNATSTTSSTPSSTTATAQTSAAAGTPGASGTAGSSSTSETLSDAETYVSVFRRDGGVLSGENRDQRYMQAYEAQLWASNATSRQDLMDRWKHQDLVQVKMKNAGMDEHGVSMASIRVQQTPASQLNFRILGARLS